MSNLLPWQEVDYRLITGNPLPPYTSINLRKNILGIYVRSPTAKPTWRFAGWLNQQISIALPVKGGVAEVEQGKRLWLDKLQVIEFDSIVDNYQVSINFPHWLDAAEVAIWQTERATSRGISQRMIMEEIDLKLSEIDFREIVNRLDNLSDISLP